MLISRSLPGVPATDVVLRDGTNTLTADWDVGAHKIENVVDPANPQDVATKNYVDTNGGGNQIFWLTTDTWADVYAKISASPGEAFNVVIPRGQMQVTQGAPPTVVGPFVIPAGLYNLDYVSFCSTGPLQLWPMGPSYADLVIEAGAVLGDNLRFDNLHVFAGDGIIPGTSPVRLELNNSLLEPLDPAQAPMGIFTNASLTNTILWNGQGDYNYSAQPVAPLFLIDPLVYLQLNVTGEVFLPVNFLGQTAPTASIQLAYTSATWLADNFGGASFDPAMSVFRIRYDNYDTWTLADYATTTATVASPQPIAWLNWEPAFKNYEGHYMTINATLSSTDAAETATFMLFNMDTSTYVEIGGPGITTLSVTGTSPTEVFSNRLNEGGSPMGGFNPFVAARYELQVYTSNAAFPAILGNATLTRI
jgi:hypothetical protein